jgi:L-lactate utilization protein LutC
MGAEAAAHRAQVSPEVERLRFASFANVVVVGAVERLGLCFMMHRVQKSRAESLMANSSIFVLKNNLEKNAKQNRNGHCLIYTSVETD